MALAQLSGRVRRLLLLGGGAFLVLVFLYGGCTARVLPGEVGVVQRRFGPGAGIEDRAYGPGLYLVGPGTTLHTFPRALHVLEASNDRVESRQKAPNASVSSRVESYFDQREELLGQATHRTVDALTVQTSDGYSVIAEVVLLYGIQEPVKVAREFGFGQGYVDRYVINTFRSGVLAILGKMNAESFFDVKARVTTLAEAEVLLKERFAQRGFTVEKLLLGSYSYASNYEKALQDKKVAVQLTEKNRKEGLVNEERAKLQHLESQGMANITIAESEVATQVAMLVSEAELYASQTRAKADREFGLAEAESKRLKADALNVPGGRYVVALQTARMFDAVEKGVMTPEQYISFIRQSWSLVGLSSGGGLPAPPAVRQAGGTTP
ncbi:MAG: hypothetical protein L0Y66_25185 [Myxococcaceae bacterium]|nr:hypothetical protein [Myxococcaceae bacterium]MCI0669428.1 hypothetical protein [Myxococcaceae bacterium]